MKMKLPVRKFRDLERARSMSFVHRLHTIPFDSDLGYIVECDLGYPDHLHNKHSDLCLAPELLNVNDDKLPPHLRHMKQRGGIKKLLPTLWAKKNYVCDYRLLQFYLDHGLTLDHVHSVIQYEQEDFVREYIEENTLRRAAATNAFDRALFKLMNNSFFGKTLEKIREAHGGASHHQTRAAEAILRPTTFKRAGIFNENLVAVELNKSVIKLNKPIYVGFTILELSKLSCTAFSTTT